MPSKKEKADTSYEVRSENTGGPVCGPYDTKKDADRECKRLNKEARTGKNAAGDVINFADDGKKPAPILHRGVQQSYEVVSGVVA